MTGALIGALFGLGLIVAGALFAAIAIWVSKWWGDWATVALITLLMMGMGAYAGYQPA